MKILNEIFVEKTFSFPVFCVSQEIYVCLCVVLAQKYFKV